MTWNFKDLKDPMNYLKIGVRGSSKMIALGNIEEYRKYKDLGRNDKCACNSGRKFKKCCINRDWSIYKEVA